MATTFLGPRPSGLVVRHIDGNDTDARLSNLAYGTPLENVQDTIAHGRHHQKNQSHCGQGHEFTPENTYNNPRGFRECRTCARGWKDKHYRKKKAAA